jgi:hypothetical protein
MALFTFYQNSIATWTKHVGGIVVFSVWFHFVKWYMAFANFAEYTRFAWLESDNSSITAFMFSVQVLPVIFHDFFPFLDNFKNARGLFFRNKRISALFLLMEQFLIFRTGKFQKYLQAEKFPHPIQPGLGGHQ